MIVRKCIEILVKNELKACDKCEKLTIMGIDSIKYIDINEEDTAHSNALPDFFCFFV